jgi:sensor c-di-GMP phosphodiesterase-like protein
MSAVVNAIISGRHRRLLRGALWGAVFAALLTLGYGFVRWQVLSHISGDERSELARVDSLRTASVNALQLLQRDATATPCSREFLAQVRRVEFLPDGLSEFLFAPGGRIECTSSQLGSESPVLLAPPDIPARGPGKPSWRLQRDLTSIGLPGVIGTIIQIGDFAVAVPPYTRFENETPWLRKELVARDSDGELWNIAGDRGLYARLAAEKPRSLVDRLTVLKSTLCDPQSPYCVAAQANLFDWARDWFPILSSTVLLAALFAWVCSNNLVDWLGRYWSFEARFKRLLSAESVVVAYQPLVDLKNDEIVGVEVLARWRDVDGTLVAPGRFIDIVARSGRTREFTRMVADRAYAELSEHIRRHAPLEVSFNVFVADFDSSVMLATFDKFLGEPRRFRPAVELVENHDIDYESAQGTIEVLAAAGVRTFIDDFGTGYSSLERVARLAVHGVKLDRSFAMCPPDSVMGRMLVQVIEIIKTTGRLIIVEGVETIGRLNVLRSTGMVDYVQGYVISRPVDIRELEALLSRGKAAWAIHHQAAA